jgi:dienelactone hydrolase
MMEEILRNTFGKRGHPGKKGIRGPVIPMLMSALLSLVASIANATCSPFGDAPAQMYPRIHAPSTEPDCASVGATTLGTSADIAWKDSDGTPRYACLWKPSSMPGPMPLLVYLHPSMASAEWVTDTDLLDRIDTLDLSGDPARPGFILLAPQGRFSHHYYGFSPTSLNQATDAIGTGWDTWYRQLNPDGDVTVNGVLYKENVDAAAIDHFIQQMVATGLVDTNRIYISGWSNGAAMAYLYALNRPNIAAMASYSALNPYAAFDDTCKQTPVAGVPANISQSRMFSPATPTTHVHNYCDIWGECPNILKLQSQLVAQGTPVTDVVIDSQQRAMTPQGICMAICGNNPNGNAGNTRGAVNHFRWPTQWTSAMGEFLRSHPLDSR